MEEQEENPSTPVTTPSTPSHGGGSPSTEAELKNIQWTREFHLKRIDLWAKFLIPLITVIVGFCQFSKQQTANEELRFSSELWIRQHQMYSEITDAVGGITMQIELKRPDTSIEKAIEVFKRAYWKSTLIEDASIKDSLQEYNAALDRYLAADISDPDEKIYRTDLAKKLPKQGERLILVLSQSLKRKSLKEWNLTKAPDSSQSSQIK